MQYIKLFQKARNTLVAGMTDSKQSDDSQTWGESCGITYRLCDSGRLKTSQSLSVLRGKNRIIKTGTTPSD